MPDEEEDDVAGARGMWVRNLCGAALGDAASRMRFAGRCPVVWKSPFMCQEKFYSTLAV